MADKDFTISVLKKFGLTENEAKVYIQALKLPETSPYELSKLTKIPRTTVYDIVLNLSHKGLVELQQSDGFTKQQTKIKAKNPSTLREIIRGKHKDLNSLEVDVVDILPYLQNSFLGKEPNADFQFFPGIDGAKKTYFGENYKDIDIQRYVFDNLMPMDVFGKKDTNNDVDMGTDAGMKFYPTQELVPESDWCKHVISYQYGRDKNYLNAREYRMINNPIFRMYQRMTIIGSKVLISCSVNNEVWGMEINSSAFAESLLSIFKFLWIQATPITEDIVRSWGTNQFLAEELRKKEEEKAHNESLQPFV